MSVVVVSVAGVKVVVKVRVLPTADQAAALAATLRTCNESASWLSGRMHELRVCGKYEAQKRFYTDLKARFGLSAQPAIRVIGKVADAYTPPESENRRSQLRSARSHAHNGGGGADQVSC